jgi:hypothetical protein
MGLGVIIKALLFSLFGLLSAAVSMVVEPTYDRIFVPEMAPGTLFASWSAPGLFAQAQTFSAYLLVNLVDPLAVLVIVGVGLLYLLRAVFPSLARRWPDLAPRLVLGVLLANLAVPIADLIFTFGSAVYPIFYTYGGGAWQSYYNIVGPAGLDIAWDNGLLALIGELALLVLTLLLAYLVALRDVLVAVLVVLLPLFTLLWPWPFASSLARRAWRLFVEMVFLPCFLVVPLALAVGSQSVVMVLAFFGVALGMPALLASAGSGLAGALGAPAPSGFIAGGLSQAPRAPTEAGGSWLQHGTRSFRATRSAGAGRGPGTTTALTAPWPSATLGPASAVVWGVGEGVGALARHLGGAARSSYQRTAGGRGGGPAAPRTRPPAAWTPSRPGRPASV